MSITVLSAISSLLLPQTTRPTTSHAQVSLDHLSSIYHHRFLTLQSGFLTLKTLKLNVES